MSDPVTNAEVEDVLSSIRRLVSEDKRPLQARKAPPANDRLVLTPALRVADAPEDEADAGADEGLPAEDGRHDAQAEEEMVFDDPAHDYEADPYNFSDADDQDGESDEAVILDGLESETDADRMQDSLEGDALDADDEATAKAATLSAKIEALETAIGGIADTWEPDEPGSDDYSGTEDPAMAWEDDVERDAMGAPVEDEDVHDEDNVLDTSKPQTSAEPQPRQDEEQPSAQETDRQDQFEYAPDDQLIDEEALRDLVSDIVRAELQGALGERITRNVRKLVRREIHRALTAQELD